MGALNPQVLPVAGPVRREDGRPLAIVRPRAVPGRRVTGLQALVRRPHAEFRTVRGAGHPALRMSEDSEATVVPRLVEFGRRPRAQLGVRRELIRLAATVGLIAVLVTVPVDRALGVRALGVLVGVALMTPVVDTALAVIIGPMAAHLLTAHGPIAAAIPVHGTRVGHAPKGPVVPTALWSGGRLVPRRPRSGLPARSRVSSATHVVMSGPTPDRRRLLRPLSLHTRRCLKTSIRRCSTATFARSCGR